MRNLLVLLAFLLTARCGDVPAFAQQRQTAIDYASSRVSQPIPDDGFGVVLMCRNDATPVAVVDGEGQHVRCNGNGEFFFVPAAGVVVDTNTIQLGGVAIDLGAGAVGGGTQRFVHASNDPAVVDLAAIEVLLTSVDADTAAMVIDLAAIEVLQTAIEGDTTAIQAAVEILDNIVAGGEAQVDVITSALPAGAATEATLATRVAAAQIPAALGQTTAANSLPVVLPSDVVHETQGDQVTPSTQTTVACDDTGVVTLAFQAGTVRAELWNTSASDVCVRWGAGGVPPDQPDRTTLTTCSFVLGSHAGSGTSEVYVTPAGFRVGAEAFECDTVAAPGNLVVTEWITQ